MSNQTKQEELARKFHNTYEDLAPNYGYETRKDTKEFDPTTPNGKLMMEVCSRVVNSEVTSVLDELENKKGIIATGYDKRARTEFTDVVPLKAIQSIRSRYEG